MTYRPAVLIADDCETFRAYFSTLLGRMGFDVIPAADGNDAVKLAKIFKPDVITLDTDMPVAGGIPTLRTIKKTAATADIPVIMVSVDGSPEIQKQCGDLGCCGYLTKPVKVIELHEVLQNAVLIDTGFNRKNLRTQCTEQVILRHGGKTEVCTVTTLSEGGMFIRRATPLAAGTDVSVTVASADGPIILAGKVIYTKGIYQGGIVKTHPGIAIAFDDMTKERQSALKSKILNLLIRDIHPGWATAGLLPPD